ncbi:MAG: ABC transporter substrate-binding protein [Burkholderiaceae bacterium]|nr:ABC transporter substrate-binding protein [Burkholderiaceae bacterium]
MTLRKLKTVTRTQGNNAALKDASVRPAGFEFDFEEVPVLVDGFRRMVRGLEFDVCEMALTTYLCAKSHGTRFTALPIFLVRGFHHGAILLNRRAAIGQAKDLEGRRLGVNRGYTVTTGVWARGVLQAEYGVDLDKITWVLSGDEHVQEYRPPANVVPLEKGRKMEQAVVAGELDGVINLQIDHPDVVPLIADAEEAGYRALRQRGHYPANHLVVVRDELLQAEPGLAAEIFEAFAESKRRYVRKLAAGEIDQPTAVDRMHQRVMQITGRDPLPYGIEPNRAMLEELMAHATAQKILARPLRIEDVFAPATHSLQA